MKQVNTHAGFVRLESDVDDFLMPGPEGEWDEPSLRRQNHKTHWSDFPEGMAAGSLTFTGVRPRLAGRNISRNVRSTVLLRDGYQCVFCRSTRELQIDHIRPVSHGGGDEIENLQVLCRSCNLLKGTRLGP